MKKLTFIMYGCILAATAEVSHSAVGRLPEGSYQNSCHRERLVGLTLKARCRNLAGFFRTTSLDIRNCVEGSIENVDGELKCQQETIDLPEGSYRDSCKGIQFIGDYLLATCRDLDGRHRRTYVDLRDCQQGEIENHDGELICNS